MERRPLLHLHRPGIAASRSQSLGYLTGYTIHGTRALSLVTLELEWEGNVRSSSCIPAGLYPVVQHSSAKFPRALRVEEVPGRSGILFHVGNVEAHTRGCILPGLRFGHADGDADLDVLESRLAMNQLLEFVTQKAWLCVTADTAMGI